MKICYNPDTASFYNNGEIMINNMLCRIGAKFINVFSTYQFVQCINKNDHCSIFEMKRRIRKDLESRHRNNIQKFVPRIETIQNERRRRMLPLQSFQNLQIPNPLFSYIKTHTQNKGKLKSIFTTIYLTIND